jgi:hypothetical protein
LCLAERREDERIQATAAGRQSGRRAKHEGGQPAPILRDYWRIPGGRVVASPVKIPGTLRSRSPSSPSETPVTVARVPLVVAVGVVWV